MMKIFCPRRHDFRGFTLIELLIVIAIILILISIALPNFLEAQLRARVTKSRGELHTLRTTFEEYNQDWRQYPRGWIWFLPMPYSHNWGLLPNEMTTPVKYITKIFDDLFAIDYKDFGGVPLDSPGGSNGVRYRTTRRLRWDFPGKAFPTIRDGWKNLDLYNPGMYKNKWQYMICSVGPDKDEDAMPEYAMIRSDYTVNAEFYSPTNGTVSSGDLVILGP